MTFTDGVFTRYVGRLFVFRFLGLLAFFVIVLQMLDLLNRSEAITGAANAAPDALASYVMLRAPEIASQFTPFAALLAIVITLSALNLSSEIVVMRAAGMSINRALRPIVLVCLGVAVAHFVFHEMVVVRNSARLAFWEANDFAGSPVRDTGTRTKVKLIHDEQIIAAESAARVSDGVTLTSVVIYDLDKDGLARSVIEAERATYEDGGWRLSRVRQAGAAAVESLAWPTTLDPELLFALSLNPDRSDMGTLVRQISQLRRDGADIDQATTTLLSRFSKPMATLLMPLLGAIAGFGVSRQGNQLVRAAAGGALGFIYFVAENLMLAIGKLGTIPPMLGAFFPFALFLVVGFAILLAMEN